MAQTSIDPQYEQAWREVNEQGGRKIDFSSLTALGTTLLAEFELWAQRRQPTEERWLKDIRQYKGIYEPEIAAELKDRSEAYQRRTTVKVDTATARQMDLLFPANRERNYEIKPSPKPSLPPHKMRELMLSLAQAFGGKKPEKDVIDAAIKQAADKSASGMLQTIDDQLSEAKYKRECRKVMFSGNLYGTGILKGPLVTYEARTRFQWKNGQWRQVATREVKPYMQAVPVWRWYPDPEVTELGDGRGAWEHHRLSKQAMMALADRPKAFDSEAIKRHVEANPDGLIEVRWFEQELRWMGEKITSADLHHGQFDVFERWGWFDGRKLAEVGVQVPSDRLHEMFFANVWVLPGGVVIKAALLPEGSTFPYYLYQFKDDETSLFGEGIASLMRHDQDNLNSSVRAMLDNAAICAGPQMEVNIKDIAPTADVTSVRPFKVWPRTEGNMQFPAVKAINLTSHVQELAELAQYFDTSADDITAIPRYMSGENPTAGAAGTMGGLSMLMNAANIAMKNLVLAFDEGITKPFVSALYAWNMRFNPDDSIKGDFDVIARGAASLVAKEVRAQSLQMFAATLQPEERPSIKWDELVRQRADAQDLSDVVKTAEELKADQESEQAQMAQQLQQAQVQLAMQKAQGEIAKVAAEVQRLLADAERLKADAINKRVDAVYSAFQAGGVAATNPTIAPAGDAIVQSAGYTDAPQVQASAEPMQQPQQPGANPQQIAAPSAGNPAPQSPAIGQERGIETPEIEPVAQ